MTEISDVKPRPKDLLANMGVSVYKEAYENKRSLTAHLNSLMPEKEYNDGLDGFQRLLACADIAVSSDFTEGYWADEYDKFLQNDSTRALVPEFLSRQWRRVSGGKISAPITGQRDNVYQSFDQVAGSSDRLYFDSPTARWDTQLAPAIPLAELIAITQPITGDSYRAFYLTSNTTNQRMVRVTEGADIPRAKLTGGDRTITLHKYGRAIEATYESLRRMRIDMISLHVQRMAVQAEIDKVAAVIDVLVNGDGNSGTSATSYNLTTLDSGTTANNLTLKAWLAFRMKFANPYFATTVLAQEGIALSMLLLNVGTANQQLMSLPASTVGALQPINPGLGTGLRLGWTSDAPANKIVAFDRRIACMRLTEVGADISEVEKFVAKQTQILTLTEVEGYAIIDGNATRVMAVNA